MSGTLDQLMRPNPIYSLLTEEGKRQYAKQQLSEFMIERNRKADEEWHHRRRERDRELENEKIREQLRQGIRPTWSLTGLGS